MQNKSIYNLPLIDNCTICIVGLGYVGLPLAIEFSKIKTCLRTGKKLRRTVIGFDLNQKRIEQLKLGLDITKETEEKDLNEFKSINFTSDLNKISKADVFIISVPTPIDINNNPDLNCLEKATESIGEIIKTRAKPSIPVIIYESTVYPGTTEEICVPILEEKSGLKFNEDFFCGYSPERINPGDKNHTIRDVVKVTSGSNKEVAIWIDAFYGSIIDAGTYKAQSIKIAEAAKIIENTQRDINIALVNELAIIFKLLEIDTLDTIKAASTKWNFIPFKPGLVGGHCIGVDPYYLTYKSQELGYLPEVVLAGRKINDGMAKWVVEQLILEMCRKDISTNSASVLILGFTFKENCSDIRNTKVVDIVNNLRNYDIDAHVIDPHADKEEVLKEYGYQINNEFNKEKKYKLVILAVAHTEFLSLTLSDWESFGFEDCLYVDIKGIIPRSLNPLRI